MPFRRTMSRQWSQRSSALAGSHDLMAAEPMRSTGEGAKITNRAGLHTSTTCRAPLSPAGSGSGAFPACWDGTFPKVQVCYHRFCHTLYFRNLVIYRKRAETELLPGFPPWQLPQDRAPGSMNGGVCAATGPWRCDTGAPSYETILNHQAVGGAAGV